jgi:catechol 2,3-dioxygenase-like lactoylglutathione lyase family enzyme
MASTSLHHIAFACKDPVETHRFYADVLGLKLVYAELRPGPQKEAPGSWVKHFFYDLGDGSCIAFFQLHGAGEPETLETAISTGLGLPVWVNHVAIRRTPDELARLKKEIADKGVRPVFKLDHGWCKSVYYVDPNGILIELCADTPGMPQDPADALAIVLAKEPPPKPG